MVQPVQDDAGAMILRPSQDVDQAGILAQRRDAHAFALLFGDHADAVRDAARREKLHDFAQALRRNPGRDILEPQHRDRR